MANTNLRIKSHSISNGWHNIETADGKKVSALSEKNPKIKALLESHPDGDFDLPCSLVEKNGKWYAWDAKEAGSGFGGFKKGNSATDESFALSYAKDFNCSKIEAGSGLGGEITAESVIKDAEKFYNWLKSKK